MSHDIDQHWHVRIEHVCVNCGKVKPPGLLVCWFCHDRQKARNNGGYSKRLEKKLADRERALAKKKGE